MDQAAFFLSFLVVVETIHSFTKKCFPDDFLSFCFFFFLEGFVSVFGASLFLILLISLLQ